jgi:DNA-binding MarR family transcriptional regulator
MPGFVPEPLVRSHPFAYAQPVGSRMGDSKKTKSHVDLGPLPGLIGYVLRRAQLAVFQDFFTAFAPHNIRPAQFSVLTVIERNPGLTQSQVAGALGIKRTNFVGMLDELEKRGLAERRQAARDKRSYALYLTADGAALMRKLKPVIKAHESRMVTTVGEAGRETLIALLREIADGKPRTTPLRNGKASRAPRAGSAAT